MSCRPHHHRPFSNFLLILLPLTFTFTFTFVHAQSISTSTPVPPLQWLNLTALLQGPAPPPLMDASLGYDEGTRTLLIFGGESQGGFVQSSTYLYVLLLKQNLIVLIPLQFKP